MSRQQKRRLVIASAIVFGVATFLSVLYSAGQFDPFQRQLSDIFLLTKTRSPELSRFVVIVAMDDKSLVELRPYGRVFNWPRSLHADVVRRLTEGRARTIVFDVLFDAEAEGDEELVAALQAAAERATAVIMPMSGDPLTRKSARRNSWETFSDVFEPNPTLKGAVGGLGMANAAPDRDGTVRRMPLVFDVANREVPSLSLLSVAKFLRRPEPWDAPISNDAVELAGRRVPIDEHGAMVINYAGGPYESSPMAFPVVSFSDVLNGRIPPETFDRKLAIIGLTATGFADDYWTPPSIDTKMDGVEIHANAIETILRAEFLRDSPPWMTIVLIFGFGLIAAASLVALPPLVAMLACGLVLVVFIVAASASFDNGGIVLNLIYPPMSLLLTFGGIMLYRVIVEQGQTRAMRGVLSQYLSPAVMAEVTRDPDSLKLGGDQREMTVLFTDLRDFTTISESLDPEALVHLFTEYLTAMSDVIFKHEGTIDKYMGDAIMAFWGAPQRQDNHADLACRAALDMIVELDRLNAQWAAEGRSTLFMRIGINSGVMKVGNMGSSSRFDYTVMGDAVNVGARLEALNKQYGTRLITSGETLRRTETPLVTRFLDLVVAKGKTEPVDVYEVLTHGDALGAHTSAALEAYTAGVRAYQDRDWLRAAAHFQEALKLAPNDGPSDLYLQRCQELMEDPPPADWNGVFVMTHK
jgi:adenylate cyclase